MRLRRIYSIYLSVAIVTFFLVGSFLLIPKSPSLLEIGDAPPASEAAILTLKDFRRSQVKNGKKEWEIIADQGEFYRAQNILKLYNPKFEMFREQGKRYAMIANQAIIHLEGAGIGKVDATGNVVVSDAEGTVIESEELFYDKKAQLVTSGVLVSVRSPKLITQGVGMRANVETQDVEIFSKVKMKILPQPKSKKQTGRTR